MVISKAIWNNYINVTAQNIVKDNYCEGCSK